MSTIHPIITPIFYAAARPRLMRIMRQLERMQWWGRDQIVEFQHQALHKVLEYAGAWVPYYRDLFKQIGFDPADFLADPNVFQYIPPLTKSLIRENRDRLITTNPAQQKGLYQVKTGGTTGEPLWFTKDAAYRDWNVAHDYHVMTWSGWQPGNAQFWLWGHVPDRPADNASLKGKIKDWLANRFDTDAFIMSSQDLDILANLLEKHSGGVLWSYVSTLYNFVQYLQERGHSIHLKAVYTAAEPLFDHQRQSIESVLGCPVFNNYSSIDTGDIASECAEHCGLHIMMRNCYVEVLRNEKPVPDGEQGELVLTTLTNYGMPLIRYKIEDWGVKSRRTCACGRGMPMLEVIEGRQIDLFRTRDGRVVYGAFVKDLLPTLGDVRQFQVVQESLDLVVFRIVHQGTLDEQQIKKIAQVCHSALGQHVEVQFEFVNHLPSTPTGKHRYLISKVDSPK